MKAENNNKNIQLFAFLAMLAIITLLCIFLYFGGYRMTCCGKIIICIFIGIVAVLAIVCICCIQCKPILCDNSLYVEDAGIYILYKGKKKIKFCRIQDYESVEDVKASKESISRIFIKEGTFMDKEFFDFLKDNGYEFSLVDSGNVVCIKEKANNTNNENKADGGN